MFPNSSPGTTDCQTKEQNLVNWGGWGRAWGSESGGDQEVGNNQPGKYF